MRRTLLLLFAAALLAGCGGDTVSLDPIAQAATNTKDVPGAHFVMTGRIVAGGEGIESRFSGTIADHGRRLQMRMTMSSELLGMKGVDSRDVTFEAIGDGRFFYFRGGPYSELAGGKWVRVRDDARGINLGKHDPSQMLEYLRATSEVEEIGEDTIRGVATKHYQARIQLDRFAERVSPEVARAFRQLTQGAHKEITLEVWIDDDGLLRRLTMNWNAIGSSYAFEMELFDFGDVDIEVPDASETVDLTKLLGGG